MEPVEGIGEARASIGRMAVLMRQQRGAEPGPATNLILGGTYKRTEAALASCGASGGGFGKGITYRHMR